MVENRDECLQRTYARRSERWRFFLKFDAKLSKNIPKSCFFTQISSRFGFLFTRKLFQKFLFRWKFGEDGVMGELPQTRRLAKNLNLKKNWWNFEKMVEIDVVLMVWNEISSIFGYFFFVKIYFLGEMHEFHEHPWNDLEWLPRKALKQVLTPSVLEKDQEAINFISKNLIKEEQREAMLTQKLTNKVFQNFKFWWQNYIENRIKFYHLRSNVLQNWCFFVQNLN